MALNKTKKEWDRLWLQYNKLYDRAAGKDPNYRASHYPLSPKLKRYEFETMYLSTRNDEITYYRQAFNERRITKTELEKKIAHMNINRRIVQIHEETPVNARQARAFREVFRSMELYDEEGKRMRPTLSQIRWCNIELPDEAWDIVREKRKELFAQGLSKYMVRKMIGQIFFGS